MKQNENPAPPSRIGAVVALIAVLALLVVGIALQRQMRANSQTEDCLLSGRKNCAPIDVGTK